MGDQRAFRASVLPLAVGVLPAFGLRRVIVTPDAITYRTISGKHVIDRRRVVDASWRPMWRSLTFEDAGGNPVGHSLAPNSPRAAFDALTELGWPGIGDT